MIFSKPKLTRKREEVHADVLEFFRGRFVNLMADRYPGDVVDAVVAVSFDDLVQTSAKIEALAEFKNRPDFEPLAVAFKRVCNIVKEPVTGPVDPALFQDDAEGELFRAYQSVGSTVASKVADARLPGGTDGNRHPERERWTTSSTRSWSWPRMNGCEPIAWPSCKRSRVSSGTSRISRK